MYKSLFEKYPSIRNKINYNIKIMINFNEIKSLLNINNIYIDVLLASYQNLPMDYLQVLIDKNNYIIDEFIFNNNFYKSFFQKNPKFFNRIVIVPNESFNSKTFFNKKNLKYLFDGVSPHQKKIIENIILTHDSIPFDIIESLIELNPEVLNNPYIGLSNLSYEIQDELIKLDNEKIDYYLAFNSNLSIHTLDTLYIRNNPRVLQNLALNNINHDYLWKLYYKNSLDIKIALSENLHIPIKMANYLFNDSALYIRAKTLFFLWDNLETAGFLNNLKYSFNELAEIYALKMKNQEILYKVYNFHKNSSDVIYSLAINNHTPIDILEAIVFDTNDDLIYSAILGHQAISDSILEYALLLGSKNVILHLSKNTFLIEQQIDKIFDFLNQQNASEIYLFFSHKNTSQNLISKYYKDGRIEIDMSVSKNPQVHYSLAKNIINKYCNLDNSSVLKGLAQFSTNPGILTELFMINKQYLFEYLAENHYTPSSILNSLSGKYFNIVKNNPNYKTLNELLEDIL